MEFPEAVYTAAGTAHRQIGSTTLPLTASTPSGRNSAHGTAPKYGLVTVQVSGTCTITLWLWSHATQSWVNPGSAAASYQKVFTGAGMDYFAVRPGTPFYISSDVGGVIGYTDGEVFKS
ncbi:MAG: hypothetical protein JSS82_15525 [Bacteroidetes bacterium]|nr:hypothetical protein [Bacteroidota bacterium]